MIIKNLSETKNLLKIYKKCMIQPIRHNGCDAFSADIYKSKCIEALKCEKPYELAFIIDKKTGQKLGEFIGNQKMCNVDIPNNPHLLLVHGHPLVNGVSLPVSVSDFLLMNNHNIDKIVAYNLRGEQSYLQKQANFKTLEDKEVKKLIVDYIQYLVKTAPKKDTIKINNLIKYSAEHKDAILVKQEIAEMLSTLQLKSGGIVDAFWKETAPRLNLEYFSNFT